MKQQFYCRQSKPRSSVQSGSRVSYEPALKYITQERNKAQSQSEATIKYLTQYLNQLVLDNCKLKTDLCNREKEAYWLQQELLRKEEEIQTLRQSKTQIDASIKTITRYNQSYIQQLQKKDKQIDLLRKQLLQTPQRHCDYQDSQDTEDFTQRGKEGGLNDGIANDIRESNQQMATNFSVLENAKRFVALSLSCLPTVEASSQKHSRSMLVKKL